MGRGNIALSLRAPQVRGNPHIYSKKTGGHGNPPLRIMQYYPIVGEGFHALPYSHSTKQTGRRGRRPLQSHCKKANHERYGG